MLHRWTWIVSVALMVAGLATFLALWFTTPPAKAPPVNYNATKDPFGYVTGSTRPTASDLELWNRVLPTKSSSGWYVEYPQQTTGVWSGLALTESNALLLWYWAAVGDTARAGDLVATFIHLATSFYHYDATRFDQEVSTLELLHPYITTFNGSPVTDNTKLERVNTAPSLTTTLWVALALAHPSNSDEAHRLAVALWRLCITRCQTVVNNSFDKSSYTLYRQSDRAVTGKDYLGVPLDLSVFASVDSQVLLRTLTATLQHQPSTLFPSQWASDAAATLSNIDRTLTSLNHTPSLPDPCTSLVNTESQLAGTGFWADDNFQTFNYYYAGYLKCQEGSVQTPCRGHTGSWMVNCTMAPPYHTSMYLYLQTPTPTEELRESVEYLTSRGSAADAFQAPLGCGSIYSSPYAPCNAATTSKDLLRFGMKYSLNGDGIDVPTTAITTMALFKVISAQSNDVTGRVLDQFNNSLMTQMRLQKDGMMLGSYRDEAALPTVSTSTGYPDVHRVGFTPCLAAHVWTGLCFQFLVNKGDNKWNPLFVAAM